MKKTASTTTSKTNTKSKKIEGSASTTTAKELEHLARDLAALAHQHLFPSRRGVWGLLGSLAGVYNNNPWADDPGRREREFANLRALMSAAGIDELACASYPPSGAEEAGYTVALVVRLPAGKNVDDLTQMYSDATAAEWTN